MRVPIIAIGFLAVFLAGCTDNSDPTSVPEGDGAFLLITSVSVENITPQEFTPGSPIEFTVVGNCRYSGSGKISITGHAGGLDVGTAVTPVSGPVGIVSYRMALPEGHFEVPFVLNILPEIHSFALTVAADFDSFLVDNQMYSWDSFEGHEVYHEDLPPNTAWVQNGIGMRFRIPKAEE